MRTLRAAAVLLAVLWALPGHAADISRARQVVTMVYDIGLYDSELERIMNEADSRGVYGGAGSTPFTRSRDKSLTHTTMLAQRDAVLSAAAMKLAFRATDGQLSGLLTMAATGAPPGDKSQLDAAVRNVKASFEEAMWEQLARTARGNSMFPCTREQRGQC